MKTIIFVCLFVVILSPGVRGKSFDFAKFFLGSSDTNSDSKRNLFPPSIVSTYNYGERDRLEDSTDFESYLFNSSSDEEYLDLDYRNSSSDAFKSSARNESESASLINETSTKFPNNESHSNDKNDTIVSTSTSKPSAVTDIKTTNGGISTTANVSKESASTVNEEQEEVVLGTATPAAPVPVQKTVFQKSIEWVGDAYTLSILIPIAAGVLFATAIIITVAICRCIRRCCRRRRFKRKPLPESVKSLRPSDRARLLGDTSDEEF